MRTHLVPRLGSSQRHQVQTVRGRGVGPHDVVWVPQAGPESRVAGPQMTQVAGLDRLRCHGAQAPSPAPQHTALDSRTKASPTRLGTLGPSVGNHPSINRRERTTMQQRSAERGSTRLQTLVILAVAALIGLVALPVWVSRAAGPRDAVLLANTRAVATLYGTALLESPSPSPLATPSPETAATVRGLLQKPVVNPITSSRDILGDDEWRAGDVAPAVWITSRGDASPTALAATDKLAEALTGAIIVYVGADGVEVFAVPAGGGAIRILQHLDAVS